MNVFEVAELRILGKKRIRMKNAINKKECNEQFIQDKCSNAKIGEVRKWADGKLHEKTKHGWQVLPTNGSEYRKGKRTKQNVNFSGYSKTQTERKSELMNSKPITINTSEYSGKTEKECKEIVKQKYRAISNHTLIRPIEKDGIKIECPMRGFKETIQHIADRNVLYALGEIDTLIQKATFMFEEKNTDSKKEQTLNMLYYAVKTKISNSEYFTRLVIREDVNGNYYYDNDSTSIEKVRQSLEFLSAPNAGAHQKLPYIDRVTQWLAGVKLKVNNKHDKQ